MGDRDQRPPPAQRRSRFDGLTRGLLNRESSTGSFSLGEFHLSSCVPTIVTRRGCQPAPCQGGGRADPTRARAAVHARGAVVCSSLYDQLWTVRYVGAATVARFRRSRRALRTQPRLSAPSLCSRRVGRFRSTVRLGPGAKYPARADTGRVSPQRRVSCSTSSQLAGSARPDTLGPVCPPCGTRQVPACKKSLADLLTPATSR